MNNGYLKPCDVIDAPNLHSRTGSGRISFDERGNGVWEWQTQPGVFTRDISSEQLHRLQDTDLRLVDAKPYRNFEGLWIHDSDRPADDLRTHLDTQVRKAIVRAGSQTKSNAFEAFLKRLRLAGWSSIKGNRRESSSAAVRWPRPAR